MQEMILEDSIGFAQSANQHGCRVLLLMFKKGKEILGFLNKHSVIADRASPM